MDIGEEILNGLARDIVGKEEIEWGEYTVSGSAFQAYDHARSNRISWGPPVGLTPRTLKEWRCA